MKIPANVLKAHKIHITIETLTDGMTLIELNELAEKSGWSASDLFLDCESGYYGDSDTWTLKGIRYETPEEIQVRVDEWTRVYNERMAEINAVAEKKRKQREDKEWKEFQRLKKKFNVT